MKDDIYKSPGYQQWLATHPRKAALLDDFKHRTRVFHITFITVVVLLIIGYLINQ